MGSPSRNRRARAGTPSADAHRRERVRLRRLGRPPRGRSPRRLLVAPPQTKPKHANAHERRVTRDVGHRVAVAHGVSRSSGTFRARASPDAKSASFRKGEGNVVVVAGEGNIFDVVAIASLPNARASHRDAVEPTVESRRREHFRNPRGRDPERGAVVGEGLEKSTRRAPDRNPEFGFDRDVAFEPASPSASPATSFATPRATDAAAIGGVFASDHLNENAAEAEAEAVRRRAGKPALSDERGVVPRAFGRGAKRRRRAPRPISSRVGVPDEPTRDGASIRIRGVSDPWLADAASRRRSARAARTRRRRAPPRVSSAGEPSSPGFVPDTPRTPTGASLSSPGTPGPGTFVPDADARTRPPPREGFDVPKQPARRLWEKRRRRDAS